MALSARHICGVQAETPGTTRGVTALTWSEKKKRRDKLEAEAAAEALQQLRHRYVAQAAAAAAAATDAKALALAEVLAGTGNGSTNVEAVCRKKRMCGMAQLLAMQEAHAHSTEPNADNTAFDPAALAAAKRESMDQHAGDDDDRHLLTPGSSSTSETWRAGPGSYTAAPWHSRPEDPRPTPSSCAPTGCFEVACAGKALRGYNPAQDVPSQALPEMAYPIVPRNGFHNVWN